MILKVATYKEGVPYQIEADYVPKALDLEFIDLHYVQNVILKGSAERILHTVTFQGLMTSRIEQTCARCLAKMEKDVKAPFDLSYDVAGRETVDTTDDLRDILILGHPDRFLCRTDCKGICPKCGKNWNTGSCDCKVVQQVFDSPLQPLKKILKEKEK